MFFLIFISSCFTLTVKPQTVVLVHKTIPSELFVTSNTDMDTDPTSYTTSTIQGPVSDGLSSNNISLFVASMVKY